MWSGALCRGPESRVGPGETEGTAPGAPASRANALRLHTGPRDCPPPCPALDWGGCLPKVQQERPGCSNDFLDGVSGEPRLCVHTHTHTLSAWPRGRAAAPQSPLPGGPGQLSVASSCSPQHSYTHADLTCSGPLAAGGRGAHQEGCWVPQWGWWTCPGSQNSR